MTEFISKKRALIENLGEMNFNNVSLKKLHDLLLKQKLEPADAVIWLQGDRYLRAKKVLKLYRDGFGKKIVISGNNTLIGLGVRSGENNISLDEMKNFIFKKGINAKDLIIDDNAMNTKDQAGHVLKIAKDQKWSKIILVGSSYYQPRLFLSFLKKSRTIKWNGKLINQPAIVSWDKKPSGRDNIAKILFVEEFKKIKKYRKDLVLIKEGIDYLNKNEI